MNFSTEIRTKLLKWSEEKTEYDKKSCFNFINSIEKSDHILDKVQNWRFATKTLKVKSELWRPCRHFSFGDSWNIDGWTSRVSSGLIGQSLLRCTWLATAHRLIELHSVWKSTSQIERTQKRKANQSTWPFASATTTGQLESRKMSWQTTASWIDGWSCFLSKRIIDV